MVSEIAGNCLLTSTSRYVYSTVHDRVSIECTRQMNARCSSSKSRTCATSYAGSSVLSLWKPVWSINSGKSLLCLNSSPTCRSVFSCRSASAYLLAMIWMRAAPLASMAPYIRL